MSKKNMFEQVKHDVYTYSRNEKFEILHNLYGSDEMINCFLEFLEKEHDVVIDDMLDYNLEIALQQGDIE